MAILAAYVADIDRAVLDGVDADLADQDTKERLFDVLMRRLDLLTPQKPPSVPCPRRRCGIRASPSR